MKVLLIEKVLHCRPIFILFIVYCAVALPRADAHDAALSTACGDRSVVGVVGGDILRVEITAVVRSSLLTRCVVCWRLEICARHVRLELPCLIDCIIHNTHIIRTPAILLGFAIKLEIGFAHLNCFANGSLFNGNLAFRGLVVGVKISKISFVKHVPRSLLLAWLRLHYRLMYI